MSTPTLLCFTGPPGAGKSVLARAVSQQLELPLFDRDDFKDIMFDALGWSDREWSRRVGKASWAMIYAVTSTLVAQRVTTVLDSNFRPSDLILERLTALAQQHGVARLEVHLRADAEVLYDRYRSRFLAGGRHPGHVAFESLDRVPRGRWPTARRPSVSARCSSSTRRTAGPTRNPSRPGSRHTWSAVSARSNEGVPRGRTRKIGQVATARPRARAACEWHAEPMEMPTVADAAQLIRAGRLSAEELMTSRASTRSSGTIPTSTRSCHVDAEHALGASRGRSTRRCATGDSTSSGRSPACRSA